MEGQYENGISTLWKHITGEAIRPVDDDDEIERFNRKEEKALAAIALSVEPEQQGHHKL